MIFHLRLWRLVGSMVSLCYLCCIMHSGDMTDMFQSLLSELKTGQAETRKWSVVRRPSASIHWCYEGNKEWSVQAVTLRAVEVLSLCLVSSNPIFGLPNQPHLFPRAGFSVLSSPRVSLLWPETWPSVDDFFLMHIFRLKFLSEICYEKLGTQDVHFFWLLMWLFVSIE